MIPARYAPILFGFLLSGIMSCIVSLVASVKNVGLGAETVNAWLGAWAFAWPVAFTIVLVVAPFVRRVVAKLTKAPDTSN